MNYRVEQKYIITEDRLMQLQWQLEQVMETDPNATEGMYRIRSLYFDDLYDSCFRANEAGEDFREKFRIRTYNNNPEVIHLEIKAKEFGYTRKLKDKISKEECDQLMTGQGLSLDDEAGFVKKKLQAVILLRQMRPVQIVEYERTPLVDYRGNVRITLDRNIGGTGEVEAFWEKILPQTPLLPAGRHILEVKYDEFLPMYLKKILDGIGLGRTAFSKYYYSRSMNG